eukprot:2267953-Pyramimonas_sp.AAC.1
MFLHNLNNTPSKAHVLPRGIVGYLRSLLGFCSARQLAASCAHVAPPGVSLVREHTHITHRVAEQSCAAIRTREKTDERYRRKYLQ